MTEREMTEKEMNGAQGYPCKERWTNTIHIQERFNKEGNPTGGSVRGTGIAIDWQDGALGWDYDKNIALTEPNGAFIEDVILAVLKRLEFFQTANEGKFRCRENACAATHIEEALMWLQRRHDNRVKRQVQGEHKE